MEKLPLNKAKRTLRGKALPVGTVVVGVAIAVAVGVSGASAPPGPLPFGVYDPVGSFVTDPEVSIEHVFMPWEDVDLSTLQDADAYALERNRALLITVEPWTWTRDERNTAAFLRNGIREGYYDANMKGVCAVIGTLQSPVSVRWGHEMEVDDGQFIWSAWEPEDYISAYKRMIEICRDEAPAINVVWSPIGLDNATDYYPGDEWVDLVGLSIFGYEPWDMGVLGRRQTYRDLLTERYEEVKEFNKPVFVAEVGYSGRQDYVDLWDGQVREARPDLQLLVGAAYFNQKEVYPWPDGYGLPDWRLDARVLP